jgi:adenylate cyclase
MDAWPVDRLAAVTGETAEQLAWYASVGLLHTQEAGAYARDSLHRVRLIQYARRRGVSDEDLALAIKQQGDLLAVFEELGDAAMSDTTMADAAHEAGVPDRLYGELMSLLGVTEGEPATVNDLQGLKILQQALALGMPEDALIQLIRVFADTTERLADAEVRIFHDHVHEQFRLQGISGAELLAATEAVGKPALELVEPAVLYFHRRAYHKANRDDLLRHLAEATTPPAARPGETTATVMFVDLAGFTPLTVTLGDSGVAEVLQRFTGIIRRNADDHAGRVIKQIGDAFMLVFDRPTDAINFGLTVMRQCAEDADLPPLHIGAHHGPLLYRDGDYFGNAVNLAARVTSASDAGQFLITHELRDAVGTTLPDVRALPPRQLKGVADPVRLYAVMAG